MQFRPDWKTSLFTVLLLPLLISLGFWQLDREQEKIAILASYQARMEAPYKELYSNWQSLQSNESAAFTRVRLAGRLDHRPMILLDNRVSQGVVGYEVIQSVKTQWNGTERIVWVNRGWVKAGRLRSELPDVQTPPQDLALQAQVYVPMGKPFLLAEQPLSVGGQKPIISQHIDMQELASLYPQAEVFPYLLRLEQQSPAALKADWPAVNTKPEKHRGYAIQWFAMALFLFIFYMARSIVRPAANQRGKP